MTINSTILLFFFFFNDTATTEIYTLSLHDALPIFARWLAGRDDRAAGPSLVHRVPVPSRAQVAPHAPASARSEEHTSELQSRSDLVCRLLLEKKKTDNEATTSSPCCLMSSRSC